MTENNRLYLFTLGTLRYALCLPFRNPKPKIKRSAPRNSQPETRNAGSAFRSPISKIENPAPPQLATPLSTLAPSRFALCAMLSALLSQIPNRKTRIPHYFIFDGSKLRPVPLPKMNRAPTIRRQLSGSPKYITPKAATRGTSAVIMMLTVAAGMRMSAWLIVS